MRTIDADALGEEFKKRHRAALRWKENAILADDEEIKIRADAVLTFLSEVKLTIDNAPTVDIPNYGGQVVPDTLQGWRYEDRQQGEWICTFHSTFPQYESDEYRCSKCNGIGGKSDRFCKHCGAQMKGGEE